MTARSHTRTRRRLKRLAAARRRLAIHSAQASGDAAAVRRLTERKADR